LHEVENEIGPQEIFSGYLSMSRNPKMRNSNISIITIEQKEIILPGHYSQYDEIEEIPR